MTETSSPDLRKQQFFSNMPDGLRQPLQGCLLKWDVPPGAVVVQRGERTDFMAIVGQGRVELEKANEDIDVVEVGEAFGEAMLRYGVPSVFTARATMPTTLWILWRSDWLSVKRNFSTILPSQRASIKERVDAKVAERKTKRPYKLRLGCLFPLLMLALVIYFLGPTLLELTHRALIDMALDIQRPDFAVEYLKIALGLQPDSPELHDALGYLLFRGGDLSGALTQFRQAVQHDEALAVAQNNLGVTLLDQGQVDVAIAHIKTAIDLDPSNARAYVNLGDAYLIRGDQQEAAKSYQYAFDLDPSQLEARARWAGIMLEQGQIEEARLAYEEVVAINPRIAVAQRGLGVIAVLQGRPIDALLSLEAARLIDPTDAILYVYLGLALEALDRSKDAVAEYSQALSMSTDPALVNWVQARLSYLDTQSSLSDANQKGGATSILP